MPLKSGGEMGNVDTHDVATRLNLPIPTNEIHCDYELIRL